MIADDTGIDTTADGTRAAAAISTDTTAYDTGMTTNDEIPTDVKPADDTGTGTTGDDGTIDATITTCWILREVRTERINRINRMTGHYDKNDSESLHA